MSSRIRSSRQTLWFSAYSWRWWTFFQQYITLFHYMGAEMMLSVCTYYNILTLTLYHSRSVFLDWKQKKRRTLSCMSHNAVSSNIPAHYLKCFAYLLFIAELARSGFHLCRSWQKRSEERHFALWCGDSWGVSVGAHPEPLALVCRN
jgi:hypothetical protein